MEIDHIYQTLGQNLNYYSEYEQYDEDYYPSEEFTEDVDYLEDNYYPKDSYPEESQSNRYTLTETTLNAVFTPQEKARFLRGACYKCGDPNHFARNCPRRRQRQQRPQFRPSPQQSRQPLPQPHPQQNRRPQPPPQRSVNAVNMAQVTSNIMNNIPNDSPDFDASLSNF